MAGRSQAIVLLVLYWCDGSWNWPCSAVTRAEKEIEILLPRHQLRVLERRVARPQLTQADRALLAAFSQVLPR